MQHPLRGSNKNIKNSEWVPKILREKCILKRIWVVLPLQTDIFVTLVLCFYWKGLLEPLGLSHLCLRNYLLLKHHRSLHYKELFAFVLRSIAMRRPSSRIYIFYGSLKNLRLLPLLILPFLTVWWFKMKTGFSLRDDEAGSKGKLAGNWLISLVSTALVGWWRWREVCRDIRATLLDEGINLLIDFLIPL